VKAPFPWFGGKSRVSSLVWERFGAVPNYVEPFAGSLAVLLGRQSDPGIETVNDADCYLANFWRAVQADPQQVAAWADSPVNEADLTARHRWLVDQGLFRERMKQDPEFYDPRIAGWWVWGLCSWIGFDWCATDKTVGQKRPCLRMRGINRKSTRTIPWMLSLAARLRYVGVTCGDWTRVLGEAVTTCQGVTGVFLDPPYSEDVCSRAYPVHSPTVSDDVRRWALDNGDNPLLRIALCGYDDEHEIPKSWECVAWQAKGGYGDGKNGSRERIWFSPACHAARLNFEEVD